MSPVPVTSILRADPRYPAALARLPDPPPVLRARGPLPSLARAVAIVGTRRATERGRSVAHALAAELVRAGCVVVSGGAYGVDHAAHLGALEAGGPTVVVHASGLSARYPAEHAPLYDRIVARGGCELSERDDAESPRARHFLARNRIIAALARAVVVVEAPARSGALSTAAHARAIAVPVLAVPRVPEREEAVGSNGLIRAGALACLGAEDVLRVVEERPFATTAPSPPARRPRPPSRQGHGRAVPTCADRAELGAPAARVLAAIERGVSDLDALLAEADRPVPEVLAAVAELELRGLVRQTASGVLEALD